MGDGVWAVQPVSPAVQPLEHSFVSSQGFHLACLRSSTTGPQVELLAGTVGERSRIQKNSTLHQDQSKESSSNEHNGVHLHTLVDPERKRSTERG